MTKSADLNPASFQSHRHSQPFFHNFSKYRFHSKDQRGMLSCLVEMHNIDFSHSIEGHVGSVFCFPDSNRVPMVPDFIGPDSPDMNAFINNIFHISTVLVACCVDDRISFNPINIVLAIRIPWIRGCCPYLLHRYRFNITW